MNEVAYNLPIEENPNFVARPPDPGSLDYVKTVAQDALHFSPLSGISRATELGQAESGWLDGVYFNGHGEIMYDGYKQRLLPVDEATQRFGLDGQLKFQEPIREDAARLMYARKVDEINRSYTLAAGATTGMRKAAGLGVGMAATLLDPVNVASMFVPVVGEARFARMVQQFGGSVLKARLAAGAIEGAAGAAMVEPFVLLPAIQEQANYGLKDSAINLGFGAVLGAGLHAGLGAAGDWLRGLKTPEKDAIFEAAMNDVLKDRPVTSPAKVADFAETTLSDRLIYRDPQAEQGTTRYVSTVEAITEAKNLIGEEALRERANLLPEVKIAPHMALEQAARDVLSERLSTEEGNPQTYFRGNVVEKKSAQETISATSEKIAASAIKLENGKIISGESETGHGHIELLGEVPFKQRRTAQQGFVTTSGRLVDRAEAMQIAVREGQHIPYDEEELAQMREDGLDIENPHELTAQGVIYSNPIDQIPRRDARGKFLSTEARLKLFQDKIGENQINGQKLQDQKIHVDAKTESPRDIKDVPPIDVGDSDSARIEAETNDLERELYGQMNDPDEVAAMKKEMEELFDKELGNPKQRADGVEAAVNCIIKNTT